jgi:hypothetical protein
MSETTAPILPPTPTAARVAAEASGHWYFIDGRPCHRVKKADGKGERDTHLGDARKLNLVPSVTNILKLLHKEGLVNWKIEQAVLAVITTPRQKDEQDDAFIKRVLHTDKVQEEEKKAAGERGTLIHDNIANYFAGRPTVKDVEPFIMPIITAIEELGTVVDTEQSVVGFGYGGRYDVWQDSAHCWRLWDFKSTKKLPDPKKGAWLEHRLQLAAYAKAKQMTLPDVTKPIVCANLYVDSVNPGRFCICEHEEWESTFDLGFAPLVTFWQWMNNHYPEQKRPEVAPSAAIAVPTVKQTVEALKQAAMEHVETGLEQLPAVLQPTLPALPAEVFRGKKVVWDTGQKA